MKNSTVLDSNGYMQGAQSRQTNSANIRNHILSVFVARRCKINFGHTDCLWRSSLLLCIVRGTLQREDNYEASFLGKIIGDWLITLLRQQLTLRMYNLGKS